MLKLSTGLINLLFFCCCYRMKKITLIDEIKQQIVDEKASLCFNESLWKTFTNSKTVLYLCKMHWGQFKRVLPRTKMVSKGFLKWLLAVLLPAWVGSDAIGAKYILYSLSVFLPFII